MRTDGLRGHFEELVREYGGLYIAIMDGKVIVKGSNPKDVEEEAKRINPARTPVIFKVPREEDLICLL